MRESPVEGLGGPLFCPAGKSGAEFWGSINTPVSGQLSPTETRFRASHTVRLRAFICIATPGKGKSPLPYQRVPLGTPRVVHASRLIRRTGDGQDRGIGPGLPFT